MKQRSETRLLPTNPTQSSMTQTAWILGLLCSIFCFATPSWSEEGLRMSSSSRARLYKTVNIQVKSGLLMIKEDGFNRSSTNTRSTNTETEEIFKVSRSFRGGDVFFSYKLTRLEDQSSITYEAASSGDFLVEQQLHPGEGNESSIKFSQTPEEGIVVETRKASGTEKIEYHKYEAYSIWDFAFREPDVFNNSIAPLLSDLRSGWDISIDIKNIRAELLEIAKSPRDQRSDKWQKWVDELASEQYSVRLRAGRMLRQSDKRVVTYLEGIPKSDLDAEQLHQVRNILKTFSNTGENDTPNAIALQLSGDPLIWLQLLKTSKAADKEIVLARLSTILKAEVPLDLEAPPAEQAEQLKKIETKIYNQYRKN